MPQPGSVDDPSAVGKAYADVFRRLGGRFVTADARTLERANDGWQVQTVDGPLQAGDAVIALGPWSDGVLAAQGIHVPLWVKRGYHMHYRTKGNATLNRPVVDTDFGYVLAPMSKGIRLTSGTEFALRDAPPSPVQLNQVEPIARAIFPLEARVDDKPWMGARPFLPDMLPMIGPVVGRPGLWADFGHHHLGFTMGPVCGRLLAEMVSGAAPFTDPHPYRVNRFA
jgi:D-amino-acid dehydrogenase